MEDFIDFLNPVPDSCFQFVNDDYQFGKKWDIHTSNHFPN
jgi:hypothetical protein